MQNHGERHDQAEDDHGSHEEAERSRGDVGSPEQCQPEQQTQYREKLRAPTRCPGVCPHAEHHEAESDQTSEVGSELLSSGLGRVGELRFHGLSVPVDDDGPHFADFGTPLLIDRSRVFDRHASDGPDAVPDLEAGGFGWAAPRHLNDVVVSVRRVARVREVGDVEGTQDPPQDDQTGENHERVLVTSFFRRTHGCLPGGESSGDERPP